MENLGSSDGLVEEQKISRCARIPPISITRGLCGPARLSYGRPYASDRLTQHTKCAITTADVSLGEVHSKRKVYSQLNFAISSTSIVLHTILKTCG